MSRKDDMPRTVGFRKLRDVLEHRGEQSFSTVEKSRMGANRIIASVSQNLDLVICLLTPGSAN
jgi:hypothetical protein